MSLNMQLFLCLLMIFFNLALCSLPGMVHCMYYLGVTG